MHTPPLIDPGPSPTPPTPPTPTTLTASQLGKRLGVTGQTVRNWRDRGLKPAVSVRADLQAGGRGIERYDEQAARAWMATYLSASNEGGKKPGAGRPRGRGKPPAGAPGAEPGQRTLAEESIEQEAGRAAEESRRNALFERLMSGELKGDELIKEAYRARLTRADLEWIQTLNAAEKSRFDLDLKRGRYLEVDRAEQEWATFLANLGQALDSLAGRGQRAVAAVLHLDEEKSRQVRAAIAAEIEAVRTQLGSSGGESAQARAA